MTKDEALDLALEALEGATPKYTRQRKDQKTLGGALDYWKLEQHHRLRAITAIKQARALEKMAENARELGLDYEPDYKVTVVDDQHPNGIPLEQWGKPAPVQEPVAQRKLIGWRTADFLNETTDIKRARSWDVHYEVLPIFEDDPNTKLATPPTAQRQWVGLTDEELMQTMSGDWTSQFYFARAIEAKLKEKNT